jgi:hypothetical protein
MTADVFSTPLIVSILGALASFTLVIVVLELIRSRRLRERYALLWLVTGLVLTALSAWRSGLNTMAGWLGVRGSSRSGSSSSSPSCSTTRR